MPQTLNSIDEFQEYLVGVERRAKEHAQNVEEVLLFLAGAIVIFKDPSRELVVGTYRGGLANVLRVTIAGERYVLSYDHEEEAVQIKRGTSKGEVVERFDNHTEPSQILRLFRRLRRHGR